MQTDILIADFSKFSADEIAKLKEVYDFRFDPDLEERRPIIIDAYLNNLDTALYAQMILTVLRSSDRPFFFNIQYGSQLHLS